MTVEPNKLIDFCSDIDVTDEEYQKWKEYYDDLSESDKVANLLGVMSEYLLSNSNASASVLAVAVICTNRWVQEQNQKEFVSVTVHDRLREIFLKREYILEKCKTIFISGSRLRYAEYRDGDNLLSVGVGSVFGSYEFSLEFEYDGLLLLMLMFPSKDEYTYMFATEWNDEEIEDAYPEFRISLACSEEEFFQLSTVIDMRYLTYELHSEIRNFFSGLTFDLNVMQGAISALVH